MNRRKFLKAGLIGTGALAAGSAIWALRTSGYASSGLFEGKLTNIRPDEAAVLFALCPLFSPYEKPQSEGAKVARVLFLDRFFTPMDPAITRQFRALIHLVEHGSTLFSLRWHRFSRLDDAAQQDYLTGWQTSRLGFRRLAFNALKTMMYMSVYKDDASWKGMGYEGPIVNWSEPPPWAEDYKALVSRKPFPG